MRVGISTATFFQKVLTEDSFSVIQRCGADLCEVFLTTFCEYEREFAHLLKERKGEVEVYSVHSLNTEFEPQLFNAATRTREDAEKMFKKVCEAGQVIGAKHYTFHGQARLKRGVYFDPQFTARRMVELNAISNEYGIELCFENVHWASFNTPDFYREMSKVAKVSSVLDIKQARQSGYDWREYVDAMGDSIKNVHVSDVKDGEITMVGKGEFPFEELVARLKDKGVDCPLIIEQYAKNYDGYDEVARSVEYLKNIVEA